MAAITPTCKDQAAVDLFEFLTQKEGIPKEDFDKGYPSIDYHKTDDHRGTLLGAGDHSAQCEEIWEVALSTLDDWGEAAQWKEEIDLKGASVDERKAIARYQKLRSLIEGTIQRPIPWVLNAPTITKPGEGQNKTLRAALKNRKKVAAAITELKEKIHTHHKDWKPESEEYQRALVAGLFWFALTPQKGGDVSEDAPVSLAKYGVGNFEDYLRKKGGLGLARIKGDAPLEATALETLERKRKLGICTEQTKVLFAVLRMAGIRAHFIEPQLGIDYYYENKNERIRKVIHETIPFLGHMASGVAIEIKNGHPEPLIWILDPALQMLEPDYAEKSPYWILSLRHFFIADLASLAGNQLKLKKWNDAHGTLKQAFRLGTDSAAYVAYTNYTQFLAQRPRVRSLIEVCASVEECAKTALEYYPYNPVIHYNYGLQLIKRAEHQDALSHFLRAIDLDPRFPAPIKEIISILLKLRRDMAISEDFHRLLDETVEKLEKIKKNHASLGKGLTPLSRLINKLRHIK